MRVTLECHTFQGLVRRIMEPTVDDINFARPTIRNMP